MLIGPKGVAFLTRISARFIYGTIILGAVIGSLSDPLPRNAAVIVVLTLSLYLVGVANGYAQSIHAQLVDRDAESISRHWTTILKPNWMMASVIVPIGFFGLSIFGLISQEAALAGTKYALLFLLLFVGFVSRRVCGSDIPRSLLSGVIVASLGFLVVQLKLWSKYLPNIGF